VGREICHRFISLRPVSTGDGRRVSSRSEEDPADVLSLLGDEYVRQILVATSESPKSAKELSNELDAALSTVYDRTEQMVRHRLLVERTRIMEDGSHHSVYEVNVDHLDVDVGNGELEVQVQTRESAAERFTSIWSDIREA
jgi:predicted transcriptional regulator